MIIAKLDAQETCHLSTVHVCQVKNSLTVAVTAGASNWLRVLQKPEHALDQEKKYCLYYTPYLQNKEALPYENIVLWRVCRSEWIVAESAQTPKVSKSLQYLSYYQLLRWFFLFLYKTIFEASYEITSCFVYYFQRGYSLIVHLRWLFKNLFLKYNNVLIYYLHFYLNRQFLRTKPVWTVNYTLSKLLQKLHFV